MEEARALIAYGEGKQAEYREAWDDTFFYLSDEWYLTADLPLPPTESYGDFPQIENGVGLLRLFELDFREALAEKGPREETVPSGEIRTSRAARSRPVWTA